MNWLAFLIPVLLAAPGPTKAADTPAPLPAASLALRITPQPAPGGWKMVIANTSAKPVRIAADGRLLRFEFDNPDYDAEHPTRRNKTTGRVEPKTFECKLPAVMRPSGIAADRSLYLAPGAAYEEWVQPDLYCFAGRERAGLVAGTKVTPALGFAAAVPAATAAPKAGAPAPAPRPPFVAEPIGGAESGLAPVKEIVGEVFSAPSDLAPPTAANQGQGAAPATSSEPASAASSSRAGSADEEQAAASSADGSAPFDPDAGRIELSLPPSVDAYEAERVEIAVTVRNRGKRSVLTRLRRDNLTFEVQGPAGTVICGGGPVQRNIPTDLLTPLAGGASDTLVIRMVEPCPNETFAQPGLYQVRAILELRPSSAGPGVRAFSATAVAKSSTLVRVQTGTKPFYPAEPVGTATPRAF